MHETYTELSWYRGHGYSDETVYPDAVINDAITEASAFVDDFTRMWYAPRIMYFELDGDGEDTLRFYIPIITIHTISIYNSAGGVTSVDPVEDVYVYNRNEEWPDDKVNPKIVLKSGAFLKGHKNIHVSGIFGYTCSVEVDPTAATVTLKDRAETPLDTLQVDALSAGMWGNEITVDIASAGPTKFHLKVYLHEVLKETFNNCVMDEADDSYIETLVNGNSLYIEVTDLDSATAPPEDMPAEQTGTVLIGGSEHCVTPLDIIMLVRMLVIRRLEAPLEDAYAQGELENMAKVVQEKTDKHMIKYRNVPLGNASLTGESRIDSVLLKYRNLRPKVVAFI